MANESNGKSLPSSRSRIISAGIILAAVVVILVLPRPEAIEPQGWRLLAIFVGTILALMLRPIPEGGAVLIALTVVIASGTLPAAKALSGYSNSTVWLVLAAFFIARALIKTGLARRIALNIVQRIGHSTLGLAYSLVLSDTVLATIIPSNTARCGGVVLPIARSLAEIYHSHPGSTSGLLGTFLMLALYQGDVVVSAIFLTGQVSNPLGAEFAREIAQVNIDWARWLWVALLPGVCSLVAVPWLIFRLARPGIVRTPEAAEFAKKELEDMGPRSACEKLRHIRVVFPFARSVILVRFETLASAYPYRILRARIQTFLQCLNAALVGTIHKNLFSFSNLSNYLNSCAVNNVAG